MTYDPRNERRRADRAEWPWKDRIWWWVVKFGRGIKKRVVSLFIVALIAMVGVSIVQQIRTDQRQDRADAKQARAAVIAKNRDEARKYQACTQRFVAVSSQNAIARALRDALGSSIKQRREQAALTPSGPIRRGLLDNARALEQSREGVTFAPVPNCRATYPRGYAHTGDFPDLAPADPPTMPPPPKPKD